MKRRKLLIALGAIALTAPLALRAQQRTYRVAMLAYGRSMGSSRAFEAFRSGMRDFGYIEDRNLSLVERWSDANNEEAERLAAELVRAKPDVIVTLSAAVFQVLKAGATMPIVFGFSGDPVAAKLVDSFARPGRNLTGMSYLSVDLVGKRMELLREMMPGLKRVAIIANPQHPGQQSELGASQDAAKKLGIALDYLEARTQPDVDAALGAIAKSRGEAIVVFPDSRMMSFSDQIAAFSAKNRIPAISGWAYFAEQGGLMSYGPRFEDSFRRLAIYVDKILKGAKPADLPVELPTIFELVLNIRTAKAIGIKIPQSILVRADRVIE